MPGRIDQNTSAGCHQLIRDGATLLTSVDDILSELSYLNGLRPAPIPEKAAAETELFSDAVPSGGEPGGLDDAEALVLECFAGGALLAPDAIATQTGRPVAEVSATLMMLELKRRVAKRADGTFERR